MVKLLMENASTTMSIDLNAKSNNGNTGFHRACWNGQTSTVELLLNNADALHLDRLNSKSNIGNTLSAVDDGRSLFGPPQRVERERRAARDAALIIILLELLDLVDPM